MDRDDVKAALDSGLLAGLALALEHYALWPYQEKLMSGYRRPVAYVVGTGTLLLAFWRWAYQRRRLESAVALSLLVGLAGAANLACYAWRAHEDGRDLVRWRDAEGHEWWVTKGWAHVGYRPHPRP